MTVVRRVRAPPRVHAVELHEPDRILPVLLVGRAVPQPAAHERQVGVGVARLRGPLLIGELGPEVQLVMDVAGLGREELLEDLQVVLDVLAVVLEDLRDAPVQIARRRVVRDVERPRVPREVGTELLAQPAPHVEEVDARCRLDAKCRVERTARIRVPVDQDHGRRRPPHVPVPRTARASYMEEVCIALQCMATLRKPCVTSRHKCRTRDRLRRLDPPASGPGAALARSRPRFVLRRWSTRPRLLRLAAARTPARTSRHRRRRP